MTIVSLSKRDIGVLEKIKDPESNPTFASFINPTLPSDPHVVETSRYQAVSKREREIVLIMQQLETQIPARGPETMPDIVEQYRRAMTRLDELINDFPDYASARNNRAQVLRRMFGDSMLVSLAQPLPQALLRSFDDDERRKATTTVLTDLDRSIILLSPQAQTSLSQQAARTLSMAHTQRAAIYHSTAKLLASAPLSINSVNREAQWTRSDFEDAASRDFAFGAKYGNEIAKGLAVSTNPTAKLCGQIVREAMKKEYGEDFGM